MGGVLLVPEIIEGMRVKYRNREGAWRTERVINRVGNFLTVENVLGQRTRIHASWITGYWPVKVRASSMNMIALATITRWQPPTSKNNKEAIGEENGGND